MKELIELLEHENYSCIVEKQGEIKHKVFGKGIRPLLNIYLKDKEDLKDSNVADKVIGKAAAVILVLGKTKNVYAKLLSKRALVFLKNYEINVSYNVIVDEIQNMSGTGICKMEELVKDIAEPQEALDSILEYIINQKNNNVVI